MAGTAATARKPSRPDVPTVSLTEAVHNSGTLRVDRNRGVIYGVKVLGRESPNGHGVRGADRGTRYSPEAIARALPLYEGLKVNVDHPSRTNPGADRSALDRLGKLINCREEADGVYADLHLLKTHPMSERLLEAAESMPDAFGLSHNALGRGKVESGWYVITDIPDVRSVDVVADAGTVQGLFESKEPTMTTFRQLVEARGAKALERCRPILELEDYGAAPMAEGADAGDHKQDLLAALAKLMHSTDEADKKTFDTIVKLLSPAASAVAAPVVTDAVLDGESTEGEEDEGDAFKKAMESRVRDLEKVNGELKRTNDVHELCESLQFTPSPTQRKALLALENNDDRKALVLEAKTGRIVAAPRSQGTVPVDASDFEATYTRTLERLTGRAPTTARK